MNKSIKSVVIIFSIVIALVLIGFAVVSPQLREIMGIEPTQSEPVKTEKPIQSPNSTELANLTPDPTLMSTPDAQPIATPDAQPTATLEPRSYAEYILPDSGTRKIELSELNGMDSDTARYARNEIYARHGYTFSDSELSSCFYHESWYAPIPSVNSKNPPKLRSVEEFNVRLIKEYEQMLADGKVYPDNPSKANYEVGDLLSVLREKFKTAYIYYIKSFSTKDGKLELNTTRSTTIADMRGALDFVLKNFGLSPSEVLKLPIMKEHQVYYDAADRMLVAEDGYFDLVIEQKEMPPLTLSPDAAITVVDLENMVNGNAQKTFDEYKAKITQEIERGNVLFGAYMELQGNTIVKLDEVFRP